MDAFDTDSGSADEPYDPAVAVAWRVGAAGIAFSAFIQLQNFWLYAPRADGDLVADGLFLLRFPFLLLEYVLAAMILASLYWLTAERGKLGVLFWLAWLGNHAMLIADQVCYKLLGNHFKWTLVDANLGEAPTIVRELWSSAVVEFGLWSALNAVVLLALSGWLLRLHLRRHATELAVPAPWEWRLPLFSVYTAASAVLIVTSTSVNLNLDHHPMMTLVVSMIRPAPAEPLPYDPAVGEKLHEPKHGKHVETDSEVEALAAARRAVRSRKRKPNLVIYIIESVGALQLFSKDGELDPELTPNIARMAKNSVRFDTVYPSFPSTARSHIPMMTGGPTITWGGYTHYFDHPYDAPNVIRELNDRGYRTGVFSTGDLAFERLGDFYRDLGPDHLAYYNDARKSMAESAKLNSWGVHGDEVRRVAMQWVRDVPDDEPFALIFLTLATHHPYSFPGNHHAPIEAKNLKDKYYNALHYTDAVLQRLCNDLKDAGRLDDTLLCLTGDHGEAFGIRHAGNFIHRNYLYEENVRSFFMFIDPRTLKRPVVSHRVGQIGDLGATLCALVDDRPVEMPGQNLFSRTYQLRTVYFHKVTDPYRWGLRDGNWKFISGRGGADPQLFDLSKDPLEKHNLADDKPDMVELYAELCATWYTKTGYEYVGNLRGYKMPRKRFLRRHLGKRPPPGIKRLLFGRPGIGSDAGFDSPVAFSPRDDIHFRIDWYPWKSMQKIEYVVTRPDGKELTAFSLHLPADTRRSVQSLRNRPLEGDLDVGVYTVTFWLGARKLMTGSFEVR